MAWPRAIAVNVIVHAPRVGRAKQTKNPLLQYSELLQPSLPSRILQCTRRWREPEIERTKKATLTPRFLAIACGSPLSQLRCQSTRQRTPNILLARLSDQQNSTTKNTHKCTRGLGRPSKIAGILRWRRLAPPARFLPIRRMRRRRSKQRSSSSSTPWRWHRRRLFVAR